MKCRCSSFTALPAIEKTGTCKYTNKQLKCNFKIPVLILDALSPSCNQEGSATPKNSEKPKMQILLDEFMSTNCRFDTPTAVMIPGHNFKHN